MTRGAFGFHLLVSRFEENLKHFSAISAFEFEYRHGLASRLNIKIKFLCGRKGG